MILAANSPGGGVSGETARLRKGITDRASHNAAPPELLRGKGDLRTLH